MNKKQKRKRKYNCDGNCYTKTSMCPRVEYCKETRLREFLVTTGAALVLLSFPIIFIIYVINVILSYI